MDEPPHRLCCRERHWGPQCPDGTVMCCICFDSVPLEELAVDPEDGKMWDVCKRCEPRL